MIALIARRLPRRTERSEYSQQWSRPRKRPGSGALRDETARRFGLLARRQDCEPAGAAPQIMRVDRMADRLEAEKVGIGVGRINDIDAQARSRLDHQREPPARPGNDGASAPAVEGVVDPLRRQRTRFGEVPFGALGGREPAGRQMTLVFEPRALRRRREK